MGYKLHNTHHMYVYTCAARIYTYLYTCMYSHLRYMYMYMYLVLASRYMYMYMTKDNSLMPVSTDLQCIQHQTHACGQPIVLCPHT